MQGNSKEFSSQPGSMFQTAQSKMHSDIFVKDYET